MRAYGLWTTEAGAKPNHGMFTFWGEWEPQSKVTSLNSGSNGPRWLHEPQLNLEATKIEPPNGEWQNTDPLVFGDRFLYGVCRQFNPKSQRNTKMAKLENGDIVLFGSHIGGDFVLDTVFVVESHVPLVRGSEPSHCDSQLYKNVTLDRIQIPKCGLRLYSGQRWRSDGPFSFVPCKQHHRTWKAFSRPVIRPEGPLTGKISPNLKQNFKELTESASEDGSIIWKEVVRQVISQGCALGTSIDEPAQ